MLLNTHVLKWRDYKGKPERVLEIPQKRTDEMRSELRHKRIQGYIIIFPQHGIMAFQYR